MIKHIFFLVICFCGLLITSKAQSWSTAGNSGTNPPTNFLGTTDNKALVLKTNNAERMRIVSGGKIGIGVTNPAQKLDVNGNINLAKGFALYMENHPVLRVDSSLANTFLGNGIGLYNTSGSANTAIGYQSLAFNTMGYSNTATGTQSLYKNSSGMYNTATGTEALYSNAEGYNTATGYRALYSNTAGYGNTAHGSGALYSNTTGINNTAQGMNALSSNTTGHYNTGVGNYALFNTYSSQGNTAVGDRAGASFNNGYYNTFIGSETDATSDGIYNSIALGNTTYVSAPNQVRIGNSYITSIGGYTNWSNISDGRVKKNVKENVPGLAFINKLKPITYNLDLDAADKIVARPSAKDKEGKQLTKEASQIAVNARTAKQQVVYTGFVAQDVEKVAKELNYDFSGVDAAKGDKDLYALRYSDFVVPLVKAVQDLSKINDEKDRIINDLKARVEKLEAMMTVQSSTFIDKQQSVKISSASLEQNIPNPFNRTTRIDYVLPQHFSSAKIIITDKSGRTLKQINVPGSGKGSLNIDASTLSTVTYQYSFYVDGRLIETKQMVLIK